MSDRCASCGCLLELFESPDLCMACEETEEADREGYGYDHLEEDDDVEGDEC